MGLTLIKATVAHAEEIAENLRGADRKELEAVGAFWIKEALCAPIENNQVALAAVQDGQVWALGGVTHIAKNIGAIWAVATDAMDKPGNGLAFTRMAAEMLPVFHQVYPMLTNWVWEENKKHLLWLKAVGFKIGEARPYGVNGELFHPIVKVA